MGVQKLSEDEKGKRYHLGHACVQNFVTEIKENVPRSAGPSPDVLEKILGNHLPFAANCPQQEGKLFAGVAYIPHCLYRALRLCYENNVRNKAILTKLLFEIYRCEGNLHAIFSIILPAYQSRNRLSVDVHTLYPEFTPTTPNHLGVLRNKSLDAFEYFLEHLCTIQVEKSGQESPVRLIDKEFDPDESYTPLLAAAMRRDPQVVLLLLRYGANPFMQCRGDAGMSDAVEYLISNLNSLFQFKSLNFDETTKEALIEEQSRGLACLQYVRRAVLNIPITITDHINLDPEVELDKKQYGLHPRLASFLDLKQFRSPGSLQHLCRFSVRNQLLETSRDGLPNSIRQLPLPNRLRLYINLGF